MGNMYATKKSDVKSLLIAVIAGDIGTVRTMLKSGAGGKAQTRIGWATLTYAATFATWKGHTEIVELLRESGAGNVAPFLPLREADAGAVSNYERTALMFAAWSGDTETVTELLDDGIDVNSKVPGGLTPLMFAAWSGRLATVKALLMRGADINAQTVAGSTPLMCAAASGHTTIVRTLLEAGAGVDVETRNGSTAMMDAAKEGYTDIVQLLALAGGRQ